MTLSLFPTERALEVPGPSFEVLDGRTWVFRFQRELKTPNATIWRHWRVMHGERVKWEEAIRVALNVWMHVRTIEGWSKHDRAAWQHLLRHRERRHGAIYRLVPSTGHYIRDDENLAFCGKHLVDALKNREFIADDAREWWQCARPVQHVSPDRQFWTVVLLQRPVLPGQEGLYANAQHQ